MQKYINRKIRIIPDVLSREVSGETVLLNLENECYFGLNEVGTRIWQLLQEGGEGDTQAIYNVLLGEYDVDGNTLARDMEQILDEMLAAGLIQIT